MAKMEAQSMTIKISLCDIIETGNIREKEKYSPNEKGEYPQDIIDLAMSFKAIGQLQPINVKIAGEVDGRKQYEIIAGNRRRAACQYLVSQNEDFNQINAMIVSGNKTAIQLVENIQREDLTAQEREAAIFELLQSGMKQKEIAAQLSKDAPFVSVNISAYKIRQKGQAAGIDLSAVETSTLSEFLSVPDDEIVSLLNDLIQRGGTRNAANILAAKYKKGKETPPETPAPSRPAIAAPPGKDDESDPLTAGGKIPNEPKVQEPPKKTPGKPPAKTPPHNDEPIQAEHKMVDLNIVLTVIYDYLNNLKKQGEGIGVVYADKINAAKDILALIHDALGNT